MLSCQLNNFGEYKAVNCASHVRTLRYREHWPPDPQVPGVGRTRVSGAPAHVRVRSRGSAVSQSAGVLSDRRAGPPRKRRALGSLYHPSLPVTKTWRHIIHWVPWDMRNAPLAVEIEAPKDSSYGYLKKLFGR